MHANGHGVLANGLLQAVYIITEISRYIAEKRSAKCGEDPKGPWVMRVFRLRLQDQTLSRGKLPDRVLCRGSEMAKPMCEEG